MRKLLIAESSDTHAAALESALQDQWSLQICTDGYTTVDTLQYFTPDAMIINLNLAQKDGLSVLEECFPILPPVILALTDLNSTYISRTAESLGVGYMLQLPCPIKQIKERLTDMAAAQETPPSLLLRHLKALQINPAFSGYKCLLVAIPLFKQDPEQLLQKEIYPQVAQECDLNDERCVERVIRYALQKAWDKRNIRVWSHYFPQDETGDVPFPGNYDFIKRLSEMI